MNTLPRLSPTIWCNQLRLSQPSGNSKQIKLRVELELDEVRTTERQ